MTVSQNGGKPIKEREAIQIPMIIKIQLLHIIGVF
jgi:hypothetical protein